MPTFGWLRDPPKGLGEPPDHDAGDLLAAAPIPQAASNRNLIVDVLDQGALGSCVANAILQAVRGSHVKQGVMGPLLGSRLFGYWTSRAYHNATAIDGGTYLRTFFQALNKFGFCAEPNWPYDVSQFARMPPGAAFRAAFDQHSPTVYKKIQSAGATRIDDIKRALAAGYLVTFGTLVSESFASNELGSAPITPPAASDPIVGGHALCAVGYDGDTFEIVNSWGTEWGDGGFCKFSAEYLSWYSSTDFWLVSQAPDYSE